ncbi:MAG: zinc ABC transporter substrate-binding protein [Rhodobacteraceae bacterium]|nr:zinc ABC transporter substrate-binding protein [Paracoccaceae bacterium]
MHIPARPVFLALLIFGLAGLSAKARPLSILTDIAPVQALVSQLAKDLQTPVQLIANGQSIHDHALKPSDIRRLQAADLIIWLGPQSTPSLASIMARPEFAGNALELNALAGTLLLARRKPGLSMTSANAAPVSDAHDPHTWLYPPSARLWADHIATRLIALDPENAANYRANNHQLQTEIARVQAEGTTRLTAPGARPFLQFHDAFQYFEVYFDLSPLGTVTADDEDAASLGTILDLRMELANHPTTCLFQRDRLQAKRAHALADISGVITTEIDALGRDGNAVPASYPSLISGIITAFAKCLYQ